MEDIDDEAADAVPEGLETAALARHGSSGSAFPPYDRRAGNRDSDDRYEDRPRGSRIWSTLSRAVRLREVLVALLLLAGTVMGALGFSISTPRTTSNALSTRIDTQAGRLQAAGLRVDALETRVTQVVARVDTLSQKIDFSNYLLCVQIRRTDPASTPPGCDPLIQTWRRP